MEDRHFLTVMEENGGVYFMRGQICFGEVKQRETKFGAWGYGLDSYLGEFESFDAATQAVSAAATRTLDEARLVPGKDLDELRTALKPFAEAAERAECDEPDDYSLYGSSARHELTLGHLRRARELWGRWLCCRCSKRPFDPILLGPEGEGHICGECWTADRRAAEDTSLTSQQPSEG